MVGFHNVGIKGKTQDMKVHSIGLDVFPNPAYNHSTIVYSSSQTNDVRITIYDATGRQVRSLVSSAMKSGSYSLVWDGCDDDCHAVQPGVYIVRARTGSESVQKKLILLK